MEKIDLKRNQLVSIEKGLKTAKGFRRDNLLKLKKELERDIEFFDCPTYELLNLNGKPFSEIKKLDAFYLNGNKVSDEEMVRYINRVYASEWRARLVKSIIWGNETIYDNYSSDCIRRVK